MQEYREIQPLRSGQAGKLILGVAAAAATVGGAALAAGHSRGASGVLAGAILAALVGTARMSLAVDEREIRVAWPPFWSRRIPRSQVRSARPRQYDALREYGGWGIRFGLKGRGKAYNAYGNEGVQLELRTGEKVLLGTQRPEELAAVLRR